MSSKSSDKLRLSTFGRGTVGLTPQHHVFQEQQQVNPFAAEERIFLMDPCQHQSSPPRLGSIRLPSLPLASHAPYW